MATLGLSEEHREAGHIQPWGALCWEAKITSPKSCMPLHKTLVVPVVSYGRKFGDLIL